MFLTELQPVAKELLEQPIAFLGGFASGLLKLKPSEDPLKSWLEKQGFSDYVSTSGTVSNNSKPQSIAID